MLSVPRVIALSICLVWTTARTSAVPAGAQEIRERWSVAVDGETTWGATRLRVTRLDGDRRSYVADTRLLVELLGTRQEMRTHTHAVVSATFAPLRVESEVTTHSGTAHVRGEATDDGFVVTVRHGDETSTSRFAFDDGLDLVTDVALGDWLHRRGAGEGSARIRLFVTGSGSVREVAVERTALDRSGAATWVIDRGAAPGETIVRLDADGTTREQVSRFPPLRMVRHPDASDLTLAPRAMGGRELLFFPVDHPLPPLRRITSLTVRLQWRDIDRTLFHLEDGRQTLLSCTTDGGVTTAIVRLATAVAPGAADPVRPVTDEAFAAALGTSDFIQPQHTAIADAAREIVAEARTARAAAEALCRWVSAAIEPAMIAETLSGPEVLRRRIGKCTEYSTLFASLARAAGIPTRIALGQRLFDGQWGGHMWNEVWAGEWIPVDASADEFGGSPALLKFVHSDTVMGTQTLRWLLTESLEISIVGVEPDPDAMVTAASPEDGLHGDTWTSRAHGIRLRLPSPAWRIDDQSGPGSLLLRIRQPAGDDDPGDAAMLHLVAFDVPGGMPPRTIIQSRLAQHRSQVSGFRMIVDEPITVADAPGHRITFRGQPADAPSIQVTELVWIRDRRGCLFNLIAAEDLHATWEPALLQIAGTFEFLEE
ncbi:MAG: transglutaminase domain-containing protein [Phycisphaeraceae bacterium]|nr:transglutaminase domain-containing protein [Phycisphaeraceae bacterium]